MSSANDQELKVYEVTNSTTGQISYQPAANIDEACKQAGWPVKDCYVTEQRPRYKSQGDKEPIALYKIPCQTCPFQYAECWKPADQDCERSQSATTPDEFQKMIARVYLCVYKGQKLTHRDHNQNQKWVRIEVAIKELKPKP